MNVVVHHISGDTWSKYLSEHAHRAVFDEIKPGSWDRIDYALLAVNGDDPVAYMTCREMSHDSVYWQYGGAFKPVKDTVHSFGIYKAFMEWHRGKYKRVATYIENTNFVMLKMAMKIGFKIVGVRNYNNEVLLEHILEF